VASQRIVSPVPSLTEALFALGVGVKVIGRPLLHAAVPHPRKGSEGREGRRRWTSRACRSSSRTWPVAVKEENTRESIEALREAGITVLVGAPAFFVGEVFFCSLARIRLSSPAGRFPSLYPTITGGRRAFSSRPGYPQGEPGLLSFQVASYRPGGSGVAGSRLHRTMLAGRPVERRSQPDRSDATV
jgi:hypothetical protein